MQGSHTHIPGTNHVPRGYIVAAILSLLSMVPLCLVLALALLFFYVSTFRSMCAVPNMAVFCSSLTSWFPGMSLTYFLSDLEMVPVVPIITGITLVFTFHMRCISIVRSLYFKIFSASFLITFLSPGIATSINMHVLFSLSQIIMSGLLLEISLLLLFLSLVTGLFFLVLLLNQRWSPPLRLQASHRSTFPFIIIIIIYTLGTHPALNFDYYRHKFACALHAN